MNILNYIKSDLTKFFLKKNISSFRFKKIKSDSSGTIGTSKPVILLQRLNIQS